MISILSLSLSFLTMVSILLSLINLRKFSKYKKIFDGYAFHSPGDDQKLYNNEEMLQFEKNYITLIKAENNMMFFAKCGIVFISAELTLFFLKHVFEAI